MASQPSTAQKSGRPERLPGYLVWSYDPAVGMLVILPLWVVYIVGRYLISPDQANGAEALMLLMPPVAQKLLSIVLAVLVLAAAWSILRRDIPWARVGLVMVIEGMVYGLMLGPIAGLLTTMSLPVLAIEGIPISGPASTLLPNLVGALGAGIFEEITFRLGLLSVLAWFLIRASAGFGLPPIAGILLAILLSAAAFSLFHHIGENPEELRTSVFMFRAMAGVLLGLLFVFRGIGVCVYTHAMYDVYYYMLHDA